MATSLNTLAAKLRAFAKGLVAGSEIHTALHEAAVELEKAEKAVASEAEKVGAEIESEVEKVVEKVTGRKSANTKANTATVVANTAPVASDVNTANTAA